MPHTSPSSTSICVLFASLGLLSACGGGTETVKTGDADTAAEVDTEPPVIEHTPIENSQVIDTAVQIEAVVTDAGGSGLDVVRIYHRTNVETEHTEQTMTQEDGGRWVGTIPASGVTSSKVFYYIWALDKSGNEAEFPGAGNELSFGVTTR